MDLCNYYRVTSYNFVYCNFKVSRIDLNQYLYEVIYQIYGKHSLQNGCKRGA